MPHRSPYLILGLGYGAPSSEASRAFARATRRLRSAETLPFDQEDLNWALHQIEQATDAEDRLIDEFRVPADPAVYEMPQGDGLLNPPVTPLPRQTNPASEKDLENLRLQVVFDVVRHVSRELSAGSLPPLHTLSTEEV